MMYPVALIDLVTSAQTTVILVPFERWTAFCDVRYGYQFMNRSAVKHVYRMLSVSCSSRSM